MTQPTVSKNISGTDFTGQMTQPTVSKKALKEVVVLRIRLQSHLHHPPFFTGRMPFHCIHMHAVYSQTQNNTYTNMNLSRVKLAQ